MIRNLACERIKKEMCKTHNYKSMIYFPSFFKKCSLYRKLLSFLRTGSQQMLENWGATHTGGK